MEQSQSKKLLAGSEFDIRRAVPSHKQPMEAPSLDMRRAELSRQHVRALNTQFARFVFSVQHMPPIFGPSHWLTTFNTYIGLFRIFSYLSSMLIIDLFSIR